MDSQHPKEPWAKCEASDGRCSCGLIHSKPADVFVAHVISTAEEEYTSEIAMTPNSQEFHDTVRRIVACVNYCEGVNTKALEKSTRDKDLQRYTATLRKDLSKRSKDLSTLQLMRDKDTLDFQRVHDILRDAVREIKRLEDDGQSQAAYNVLEEEVKKLDDDT